MKAYSYIRWSTPGQGDGDSLRRQTEKAVAWAKKHGVTLDNSSYQDHGISAFKGKNLSEGKLGAFIKAVDDGVIATPCYLLVEELDRISRDNILESQHLVTSMIRKDINIVVLKGDGVELSKDTLKGTNGMMLMFGALLSLALANEESEKKSGRLISAFEQKREGIKQGVIASRYCPSWLTVNEDKTKFLVDQKKAKTIRRIFDLALNGNGVQKIAQILNDDDVELIGKRVKGGWKGGNVAGLLRQPALTGSFIQTSTGEEINPHYYPQIISKKDWVQVQASVKDRRNKGGYKQGTANLFSGLTRCAYCGETFKFITNSNGPRKDGTKRTYLYCRNSMHHAGCDSKMIPYEMVESGLIDYLTTHVSEDLNANTMSTTNAARRKQLQQEITVKHSEVEKWVKAMDRSKTHSDALVDRHDKAQMELDELQAELAALNTNPLTKELIGSFVRTSQHLAPIIYANRVPGPTAEEQKEARLKVQVSLRRLIKLIEVASHLENHKKFWKQFCLPKSVEVPTHKAIITYSNDTKVMMNLDVTPWWKNPRFNSSRPKEELLAERHAREVVRVAERRARGLRGSIPETKK